MNLPPQLSGKIGISKQQLEHAIQLLTSKVAMHQALLDAHIAKDAGERIFLYDLWRIVNRGAGMPLPSGYTDYPEPKYLQYLKAHHKAEEDIIRVQLMQLQSELALHEAMLKEAESQVLIARPGSVS
jgi:hypothetical protein